MSYAEEGLLRDIIDNGIKIRGEELFVKKYFMKGSRELLPNSFTTIGCFIYDNINLLTSDSLIQVSSTFTSDSTQTVLISGLNSNFEEISETINLNELNPVVSTLQFFRILNIRNVSDLQIDGNIIVSKANSILNAGIPVNQSDFLFVMRGEDNTSNITQLCVKPEINKTWNPTSAIYSVANDSIQETEIKFQLKYTDQQQWFTEFRFFVDERSNSQTNFDLRGVPSIPNSDLSKGLDIRIIARKTTNNGTCNISSAFYGQMR